MNQWGYNWYENGRNLANDTGPGYHGPTPPLPLSPVSLEPPDQPRGLNVKQAQREIIAGGGAEGAPGMQMQVSDGGATGDLADQLHGLCVGEGWGRRRVNRNMLQGKQWRVPSEAPSGRCPYPQVAIPPSDVI